MNILKKSLAMFLVLCLMFSAVPVTAFADEPDSTNPTVTETTEETTVPETTVSETTVPETTVPETTVPETTVPETTVPETTVPETTVPETTVPETTVPETTVPETTVPETTVPETTVPETTVPETTVPETTVPETTAPQLNIPQTSIPQLNTPLTSPNPYGVSTTDLDADIATADNTLGTKPADDTVTGEPFDTTVSDNYRIPGLVYHKRMLIASADARWNYEKDGGGMDLVVSRSTDGNTWNYTFAGYLGDNGNSWNANSTTLMDPVIISDGSTLYLLADMYPAGYSISSSSTANVFSETGTGYTAAGCLMLSNNSRYSYDYYLKDGKIYSTDGTEQSDYTVKSWFDLYQNGTYVTNLFFSDSPFQLYPTSYIALLTSTDDGATWSAPTMVNVKPSGVAWMVLGPGSGLALDGGNIAFTAYDNSNIYLIWGNPANGWNRVSTSAATNESSIIELPDGTIRAFVKRGGNNTIAYVDFVKSGSSYTAGSLVDTGVANFSNCMVSSLMYSKTYGGKPVVLVCCPSKSSGGVWGGRFNGKIYAFTLEDGNGMTKIGEHQINNSFFAYSNMAELSDGTIGLLYEDDCILYSTYYDGDVSHITYTNVDLETALGIRFDKESVTKKDDATDVTVTAPGLASMTIEKQNTSTPAEGYNRSVTYKIELTDNDGKPYDGSAVVKIPAGDLAGCSRYVGSVDGDTFAVDAPVDGYFTLNVPHFSDVTVSGYVLDADTVNITLVAGKNTTVTIDDAAYTEADIVTSPNSAYATIASVTNDTVVGETKLVAVTEIESGKQYLLYNDRAGGLLTGTTTTYSNTYSGLQVNGSASIDSTALWTLTGSNGTYTAAWTNGRYLTMGGYSSASLNSSSTNLSFVYEDGHWLIFDGTYYLSDIYGNGWNGAAGYDQKVDDGNYWTIYEIVTTEGTTSTEVTFTGVAEGETFAIIGEIKYNIEVVDPENYYTEEKDVSVYVGEFTTVTDNTGNYEDSYVGAGLDKTYATVKVEGTTVPAGTKAVPVDTIVNYTRYYIQLADGTYLTSTGGKTANADEAYKFSVANYYNSNQVYIYDGNNFLYYNNGSFTLTADNWTVYQFDAGVISANNVKLGTIVTFEESAPVNATNITITGVSKGTTSVIVGTTKYNITVNLKEAAVHVYAGLTKTVAASGTVTEDQINAFNAANGSKVTVALADGNLTFTGVAAGTAKGVLGNTEYTVTVHDGVSAGDIADFNNIVGEDAYSDNNNNTTYRSDLDMAGKIIKKLTISEGASFNLDVDITDAESVEWSVADTSIASVDKNGVVTGVKAGETTVTATVTKDGKVESISIPVVVKASLLDDGDTAVDMFYYIENVDHTTPYYTMFLSSVGTEPVYRLVKAVEGEVIYLQRPANTAWALIWTAAPDDGYALALMGSTGSSDEYYPLRDSDGNLGDGTDGDSEYYYTSEEFTSNGAPNNAYKNVILVGNDAGKSWLATVKAMLDDALILGCDGALSATRWDHDGVPKLVTSMTFISDPMPQISKTVDGVLPVTRKQANYRKYTDGMVAGVGEQVYFKITITLSRPNVMVTRDDKNYSAITYSDAWVEDTVLSTVDPNTGLVLKGAYLYDKDLDDDDGLWDGNVPAGSRKTKKEITTELNKEWADGEQTHTVELFLVYEIQAEDIPKFNIDNTANLAFSYQSEYSTGAQSAAAEAEASITVVGKAMDNIVVDFGQKVVYDGLTDEQLKYVTLGTFPTTYGTITVEGSGQPMVETEDGDQYYSDYTLIYTPTSIMQGPDAIQLSGTFHENGTEITKVINGFVVYPATTVYYEEGFIFGDTIPNGWEQYQNDQKLKAPVKATKQQKCERLGTPIYNDDGKVTGMQRVKINPYGYDPIYAADKTGSAGSYALSTAVGSTTSFTFTGTGFELFANSNAASGYVTVYRQGELSKLYMINTVLAPGDSAATNQQQGGTYYSLPLISETSLPHGTYTVHIKHTNNTDPIYIDGVRIINTVKDSSIFGIDLEDNPEFYQVRDYVLKALDMSTVTDSEYLDIDKADDREGKLENATKLAGQVYTHLTDDKTDSEAPAATLLINNAAISDKQDLLDNGPKNELFLYPGSILTFRVKANRVMQLGLKAPTGSANFTLAVTADNSTVYRDLDNDFNNDGTDKKTNTITSTVDMFYQIAANTTDEKDYLVTITVPEGSGVLSVTNLKICDDPNAAFTPLTQENLKAALCAAYGLKDAEIPTEPEVTEPEVPAETTKPTEPEVPAETTKPTEPEVPAETTKPTEPEVPAETTKPTEPEVPAETTKPSKPNKPGKPSKPGKPTESTEPEETKPVETQPEVTVPETPTEPQIPAEPEAPAVEYADAVLTVKLVDYKGKELGSVKLTAYGIEGKTAVFTAEEIVQAAKTQLPKKYALVDESAVDDVQVRYGAYGKVKVQIGKVATLNITFINLLGKKQGTATVTGVQTAGGYRVISAYQIRSLAPEGRFAVWFLPTFISYGSTSRLIIPVF